MKHFLLNFIACVAISVVIGMGTNPFLGSGVGFFAFILFLKLDNISDKP